MNILLTGGAGFIGTYTKELLKKEGHNVVIFDNFITGSRENIQFDDCLVEGDIREINQISNQYLKNIDTIIHLAAQTSVPDSVKDPVYDMHINIEGTLNILRFAKSNNVKRIIFASTAAVYGDNESLPIKEDEKLAPTSPYGISKMASEYYIETFCEQNNIDHIILRYANVYGPKQSEKGEGGVVKIFIENILSGLPLTIYGDGSQTRDFIYVEDIARAHLHALNAKSGTYNISSNTELSVNELYKTITKLMQMEISPHYKEEREGDIYRSSLDNSQYKELTKWEPAFSIEEGLALTLKVME
ncbi:NAD-dependent epimerase/dehydratase family protein [Ferdinandcohnia sp. SAFN-114]|uniref:NAD-dependent epimerase/dehydratase family protein n=1 Tax=Ferdinandcohnia sp. SAFN-114 TaxID=3387275 RepID=UPI003F7D3799